MEIYNVTYNEANSILFIQYPLCGEIKYMTIVMYSILRIMLV